MKIGFIALKKTRFKFEVIYDSPDKTTAEGTGEAACRMLGSGCDLLLFSGGDGTAGDIVSVVNKKIPILGIPAGVKIFSPIASPDKLESTPALHVDTGDHELDDKLRGY